MEMGSDLTELPTAQQICSFMNRKISMNELQEWMNELKNIYAAVKKKLFETRVVT